MLGLHYKNKLVAMCRPAQVLSCSSATTNGVDEPKASIPNGRSGATPKKGFILFFIRLFLSLKKNLIHNFFMDHLSEFSFNFKNCGFLKKLKFY